MKFSLTLSMYTVRFMKCPMKCPMKCLKALEAQIPCFLLRKIKINNNMFGKKKIVSIFLSYGNFLNYSNNKPYYL